MDSYKGVESLDLVRAADESADDRRQLRRNFPQPGRAMARLEFGCVSQGDCQRRIAVEHPAVRMLQFGRGLRAEVAAEDGVGRCVRDCPRIAC